MKPKERTCILNMLIFIVPTSVFSYGYGAAEPAYIIILYFVFENKY